MSYRVQSTKELEVEQFLAENADKSFFRTEIIRLFNGTISSSELIGIISRLKDDNKISVTQKGIKWIGNREEDEYDYSENYRLRREM